MKTLKKISFLVEDFSIQTPAQQLLDRFLLGYPRDGEFHRPEGCKISVYLSGDAENSDLGRRVKDFGLEVEKSAAAALANADGMILAPKSSSAAPPHSLVASALNQAPPTCRCFVYGALGSTLHAARTLVQLASKRRLPLLTGTTLPVTWRLPQVDVPRGTRLKEALIVVQGSAPEAELDALEGLLPVIQRRRGGEAGVRRVRLLKNSALWQAGHEGVWSWPLLASALSRSNTPQGDPVKDGRTQDLVGLGLVPGLAREPRGWMIDHCDGLRSAILVLDGVIADYNFAVRTTDNSIISAQIYRPPAPALHDFSALAGVLEDFFLTARPAWSIERSVLTCGLLEVFEKLSNGARKLLATPELKIAY